MLLSHRIGFVAGTIRGVGAPRVVVIECAAAGDAARAGSLRGPRRCVSPAGLGSPAEAGSEAGRPRRRLPLPWAPLVRKVDESAPGPGAWGPQIYETAH